MGRVAAAGVIGLLVAASAGCFVFPKTERSQRVVATSYGAPQVIGGELEVRADGHIVTVIVGAHLRCRRARIEKVEHVRTKVATVEALPTIGEPAGMLASLITLPISGLVTGLIVLGSTDSRWYETRRHAEEFACPLPGAGVSVRGVLASGTVYEATTADNGRAVFVIGAHEPASGTITIAAGDYPARAIHYHRDVTQCLEHRHEVPVDRQTVATQPTRELAECRAIRGRALKRAQQIRDLDARAKALLAAPRCEPK